MRKRPDNELIQDYAATGAQAAFAELTRRYLPFVYGVCKHELRDPDLAEDAAQAVFLVLAQKAAKLRAGSRTGCTTQVSS